MITPLRERFMQKIAAGPNCCWVWTGTRTGTSRTSSGGYGKIGGGRKTFLAHRVAYELFIGPIPDGMQIDHLCRNRACVNPAHLEAVTCRENLLRGKTHAAENAAKTHCPRGHPYDEENTYLHPSGRRCCRSCRREMDPLWKAAAKRRKMAAVPSGQ